MYTLPTRYDRYLKHYKDVRAIKVTIIPYMMKRRFVFYKKLTEELQNKMENSLYDENYWVEVSDCTLDVESSYEDESKVEASAGWIC